MFLNLLWNLFGRGSGRFGGACLGHVCLHVASVLDSFREGFWRYKKNYKKPI